MKDKKSEQQKPKFFEGKRKWIIVIAAAVIAIVCVIALVLAPMMTQPEPVSTPAPTQSASPTPTQSASATPTQKQILPQLRELYEKNSDLAGWIKIGGTKVDYPVMYTPQDPEFYLYRTFEKNEDPTKEGCIFIDTSCKMEPLSDNLLIHGHNMKNGTMFHTLIEYMEEAYYKEHPMIEFSTLYETGNYEIAAVFLTKIYNVDDDVFKFYKYYGSENKEQFDDYVKNIKELELYETGITPEYGDELITLTTCEYTQENGRIVVVARKVKEPTPGASIAPTASVSGDAQTVTGEFVPE